MEPPTIVAGRVRLRPLKPGDAPAIAAIRNEPEVARYQSWTGWTLLEAQRLIAEMERTRSDIRGAWYQFAVALRSNDRVIGDCGFRSPAADFAQAEIGFTIGRPFWGQGYGSETVRALLDWLFDRRRKRRVFAVIEPHNLRSRRLLERLGFVRLAENNRLVWIKGAFGHEAVYALESNAQPPA